MVDRYLLPPSGRKDNDVDVGTIKIVLGQAHELAAHQIDPGAIRRDAARFGPDLARVARPIFAAWLDQL
jgi:hypothetical protein